MLISPATAAGSTSGREALLEEVSESDPVSRVGSGIWVASTTCSVGVTGSDVATSVGLHAVISITASSSMLIIW
jgi:hypothetical protein